MSVRTFILVVGIVVLLAGVVAALLLHPALGAVSFAVGLPVAIIGLIAVLGVVFIEERDV